MKLIVTYRSVSNDSNGGLAEGWDEGTVDLGALGGMEPSNWVAMVYRAGFCEVRRWFASAGERTFVPWHSILSIRND